MIRSKVNDHILQLLSESARYAGTEQQETAAAMQTGEVA